MILDCNPIYIAGDISFKTNTWPIYNTACLKWAQIERRLLGSRHIKIIKGVLFILKPLTVFKTMKTCSFIEFDPPLPVFSMSSPPLPVLLLSSPPLPVLLISSTPPLPIFSMNSPLLPVLWMSSPLYLFSISSLLLMTTSPPPFITCSLNEYFFPTCSLNMFSLWPPRPFSFHVLSLSSLPLYLFFH